VAAPTHIVNVDLVAADARSDARLVHELAGLINRVYLTAESGLWRDGKMRTTPDDVAALIAAGEIAVASRPDGTVVGSVRIHDLPDDVSELGMLVSAPECRGVGIGRALLLFAERLCAQHARRALRLEVLVPREWRHPGKEFLRSWYGRHGYGPIRLVRLAETHPDLADLLATPCDVEVREKQMSTRLVKALSAQDPVPLDALLRNGRHGARSGACSGGELRA
jgi:GNAT superfamily N-acetyltransferase